VSVFGSQRIAVAQRTAKLGQTSIVLRNDWAQIGFVVLVGLAAKNAILIVEFAHQREHEGATPLEGAVHAARTRLRPILMTSFAFSLGVAPLAVATGAGAEMRRSLGTAVLFGMFGVTCFGLLFTPALYSFVRNLVRRKHL
jgi:multidrug efflux pump subunit AcrB